MSVDLGVPEYEGADMPSDVLRSTHKDLRSDERARNRTLKQKQKYYGYRGVKPSWVGQPYYAFPRPIESSAIEYCRYSSDPLVTHPEQVRIQTWTKRDQYRSADRDIWPLDVRRRVGRRKRRDCCYVPPRWEFDRTARARTQMMELQLEQGGWWYYWDEGQLSREWRWLFRAAMSDSAWGCLDTVYWDYYTDRYAGDYKEVLYGVEHFWEKPEHIVCAQEELLEDLVLDVEDLGFEIVYDSEFELVGDEDVEEEWEVLSVG